jgi:hypothetical protein
LVETPEHIVALPLSTAVGKALIVTTALPVWVTPVQLASLNAVRVYVLEKDGVTGIVAGLVKIPVIVTGVTPSV